MKIVILLCLLPPLFLHTVSANGEVVFDREDLDENALVTSADTEEEGSFVADDVTDSESSDEEVPVSDEALVDSDTKSNTIKKRQAMFQIYLNDIGGQNTGIGTGGSTYGGGDWNQWGNYGGGQPGYIPISSWQYGSGYNYNNMWPGSWGQNTIPYGGWGPNNWYSSSNWGNDWNSNNNYNGGGVQIANYGTLQGNLGSGDWGTSGPYNGGGGGGGPVIVPIPYPVGGGGYCPKSKEKKGKCRSWYF